MANQTLAQLMAKTTPISADELYLLDTQDTTQSAAGSSKSLTIGNLLTYVNNNASFLSSTNVTGTGKAVLQTSPEILTGMGVNTPANAGIALVVDPGSDSKEGLVIFANSATQSALLLDIQNASFVSQFTVDKAGNTVANTINKVTITTPATSATLTIANGKTLTANNSLILAGTDSTTMTFPSSSDTVVGTGATQTLSNKTFSGALWDGWSTLSATLTYSSTDGHTFVVSSSIDMTGSIAVGDRIKFTNNSATFYGIVTAISSSAITLYGGQNYSVANSAITNPFYSHMKSPFGFIADPAIWTEETSDTANQSQATPTASTWYNLGTLSLTIPIGRWIVEYEVIQSSTKSTTTVVNVYSTLSTANNSQSDIDFTTFCSTQGASGNLVNFNNAYRRKMLTLTSKTTYYLNAQTDQSSVSNINHRGDVATTKIRAISSWI